MIDLAADALDVMNSHLTSMEKSLALLTAEQIWRKLGANVNSVGNYCLHLAGNERQHFVTAIGGEPLIRERSAEFSATGGFTREELLAQLKDVRQRSQSILAALTEEDLEREVLVPYRPEDWSRMKPGQTPPAQAGETRTIRAILVRVASHYAYHAGEIVLLAKLLSVTEEHISGLYH
ncbi:DinB family protein [Gorillibacterium sp. sgz500922]|uniref:DinB family protein n=1 Tax=Gorillibacterium sp. sgz500922 TaxID=3446694 RepID=UPI003F680C8B